jgi:hypothetical protein
MHWRNSKDEVANQPTRHGVGADEESLWPIILMSSELSKEGTTTRREGLHAVKLEILLANPLTVNRTAPVSGLSEVTT